MINNDWDPLLADSAWLVVSEKNTSTSLLQRRMKLGYNRSGKIMDQLEAIGVVGPLNPLNGSLVRELIVTDREHLINLLSRNGFSVDGITMLELKKNDDPSAIFDSKVSDSQSELPESKKRVSFWAAAIIILFITGPLWSGLFGRSFSAFFFSDVYSFLYLGLILISYLLRSITPFKEIWIVFKWLLITLIIILSLNYAKKSLKEWWKE